jgi:hypothetical protein
MSVFIFESPVWSKMRQQVGFIPGMWGSLFFVNLRPIVNPPPAVSYRRWTVPIGSVQSLQGAENKRELTGSAEPVGTVESGADAQLVRQPEGH